MAFICGFTNKNVIRIFKKYKTLKSLKKYLKFLYKVNDIKVPETNLYPNKIWTMWLQGIDNAPTVVKICIDSIKKHSNGREVIVLDNENIHNYIKLPQIL